MNSLDAKEQDLLERVKAKPELRNLFFRRVKGLKWFDALEQLGYFAPQALPRPTPAKDPGYFTIPRWNIGEYLIKTAPELASQSGAEYAARFQRVMFDATEYAKENAFSNYQAWWQLAEVVAQLPARHFERNLLRSIDYWLDDDFDRGVVAVELGEKWLPELLSHDDESTLDIAVEVLGLLFKVEPRNTSSDNDSKKVARLRMDHYHATQIVEKIANHSGKKLGEKAARVFHDQLTLAMKIEQNDKWSSIWQPSIEPHAQNEHRNEPENVLVSALRSCLDGYLVANAESARNYIGELLESPFQTVRRIAIYGVTNHLAILSSFVPVLLDASYFASNFRHEMWRFLHQCYTRFSNDQKAQVKALISSRKSIDENGVLLEGATAYEHAIWFSAIREFGQAEDALYKSATSVAKAEPEHPDFSSYVSSGWVGPRSPYSVDELAGLTTERIATVLAEFEETGSWNSPDVRGLAKTFQEVVKATPLRFLPELKAFQSLPLPYAHALIEAYRELWAEKASLPWADVLEHVLAFSKGVLGLPGFWRGDLDPEDASLVANRNWIVSSLAMFLENGFQTDEHAFDIAAHQTAASLLMEMLERQPGSEAEADGDAMFGAINSPRGRCIEALVNLSLRECRMADASIKNHSEVWRKFQPLFDKELDGRGAKRYEFSVLVTNYLPQFMYMSRDWIRGNLARIFDQGDRVTWLCAMQGYGYVTVVYREVFEFLKMHGDFAKALDEDELKKRVSERIVENIAIAYLGDFESLDEPGSLMRLIVERGHVAELGRLIWFVWTLRKKDDDGLAQKVLRLWRFIAARIDTSKSSGRKIASQLAQFSAYLGSLNEEALELLMPVAPFADESYNSSELISSLARLSANQPFEANAVLRQVLKGSAPQYPEEDIRQIFSSLVSRGEGGRRAARETVSEYLRLGAERPDRWLREIIRASPPPRAEPGMDLPAQN